MFLHIVQIFAFKKIIRGFLGLVKMPEACYKVFSYSLEDNGFSAQKNGPGAVIRKASGPKTGLHHEPCPENAVIDLKWFYSHHHQHCFHFLVSSHFHLSPPETILIPVNAVAILKALPDEL